MSIMSGCGFDLVYEKESVWDSELQFKFAVLAFKHSHFLPWQEFGRHDSY